MMYAKSELIKLAIPELDQEELCEHEGVISDCLGVQTERRFFAGLEENVLAQLAKGGFESKLPSLDDEIFQWKSLAAAIREASHQFVMIELGAGYGRWCVNAHKLLEKLNPIPAKFVAVEAEPTHFSWIRPHFKRNGLNLKNCLLYQKSVSAKKQLVEFAIGKPSEWYGQAITSKKIGLSEKLQYFFRKPYLKEDHKLMETITLNKILKKLKFVDLLDMDIQGEEFNLLSASVPRLTKQVKRMYIATHGVEIENNLRNLFNSLGWVNEADYSLQKSVETEYGVVQFCDGVQIWLNPNFVK